MPRGGNRARPREASRRSRPEVLNAIVSWVPRLAWLNLIWILQVAAGGVMMGLAPATKVLHLTLREALDGEIRAGASGWSWAWRTWREELLASQLRLLVPAVTFFSIAGYTIMVAGTPFAVSLGIICLVYSCWWLHLPAIDALGRRDALEVWALTLRCFAVAPVRFGGAFLGSLAIVVALAWYLPGALLIAVPSVPALLASAAVTRFARPHSAQ